MTLMTVIQRVSTIEYNNITYLGKQIFMMNTSSSAKYKISRRGRKLVCDDQRLFTALPKDVSDKIWFEIFLKEECDLIVFDVVEEILEDTLNVYYEKYMDRQNVTFTVHCAALAWLRLIDWFFYRHDPGEDASGLPPCFIPKREESWLPDERPEPSPKDPWSKHELDILEEAPDKRLRKWPSSDSLDYPVVAPIPSKYWFPGKVVLPQDDTGTEKVERTISYESTELDTTNELLQRVTDYSTVGQSESSASSVSTLVSAGEGGAARAAGDSPSQHQLNTTKSEKRLKKKSSVLRTSVRSKAVLPPLDLAVRRSRSPSLISDCRLRNLRVDAQYEVSSEHMELSPRPTNK